jgi:hypothetical protein
VGLVAETADQGDLGQRLTGRGHGLACVLDSPLRDVPSGGDTGGAPEGSEEMGGTQADHRRQVRCPDGRTEIALNILGHATDLPWRKRSMIPARRTWNTPSVTRTQQGDRLQQQPLRRVAIGLDQGRGALDKSGNSRGYRLAHGSSGLTIELLRLGRRINEHGIGPHCIRTADN